MQNFAFKDLSNFEFWVKTHKHMYTSTITKYNLIDEFKITYRHVYDIFRKIILLADFHPKELNLK